MAKESLNTVKEAELELQIKSLRDKEEQLDKIIELIEQNNEIHQETTLERDLVLDNDFLSRMTKMVIRSKTYKGRTITVTQGCNNDLNIQQFSEHLFKDLGDKYEPLDMDLSEETFILLLESLTFAAKKNGY